MGRRAKSMDPALKVSIQRQYCAGGTMMAAAKSHGVPYSVVRCALKTTPHRSHSEAGLLARYNFQPGEVDNIVALYATGLGIPAIRKTLGISPSKVVRALKRAGVKQRSRSEAAQIVGKIRGSSGRHNWNGGRWRDKHGYIRVWQKDSMHKKGGYYLFEHRLIWEKHNGPILKGWHVHHINGVKDDNRIENLQAMPAKKHAKIIAAIQQRVQDLEKKNDHLERELAELKTDVEALRRQQRTT